MRFDTESSIHRMQKLAWGFTAVLVAVGFSQGPGFFLPALAAGALANVNLSLLVKLSHRLTAQRPARLSWLSVFGLIFRYILLSIALFVIISVWHANVVAVALGLSAPVAAFFVESALYVFWELRSGT